MGKISPVSSKYIIHSNIDIDGVVDRPDVIGAIFGQTEGLLGSELELRELQRSGKIGRIEVNTDTRGGKTKGSIIVPSSLDKAETAIIAASLEIIQRIGPCTAKIRVENIEDVRISKRNFVIERAKELLKNLIDTSMPDSQELSDEVAYSVRVMEIAEYGKDRLPAGPGLDESDEVIIVEGRADVLNLLKHSIKNVIALNGTSVPETIIDLCKRKIVTVFVDGDRGGDLIIKELVSVAEIDYVAKAPDGKEVEEITKKELHKALRSRVSSEQAKGESSERRENGDNSKYQDRQKMFTKKPQQRPAERQDRPERQERPEIRQQPQQPAVKMTPEETKSFKELLEDLIGTRGAYILDQKLNILGKVPVTEIITTIKSLTSGVHAVILDGVVDRELVRSSERSNINYLVGMDSTVRPTETRIRILTPTSF